MNLDRRRAIRLPHRSILTFAERIKESDLPFDSGFFTEDTAYAPSSPYSASKASSDHLVAAGLVIDVGESELMVAIPAAAAPAMSTALLADAVTLGLTSNP